NSRPPYATQAYSPGKGDLIPGCAMVSAKQPGLEVVLLCTDLNWFLIFIEEEVHFSLSTTT
ncbi:hypothetical protein scyTo_0006910, partial [Scyliorhinus torazame]|nr:hypothetical protein [Scyliorhinus torazame]